MRTKRQEELIAAFLDLLDAEERPVYRELIDCLDAAGYHPSKQRANIVFKHDLHNKQIAKIGIKPKDGRPFFALRFSACHGYSLRFADIVRAAVAKDNYHEAMCLKGACDFCKGEPAERVYIDRLPNGESKAHCGAYALEIPGLAAGDVDEIRRLIGEEHAYLLKHEAGIG